MNTALTTTSPTSAPTTAAPAALMSSREIAELTGKRHDHVMVDIRNMLEALLNSPEFSGQLNEKELGDIHGTYKDSTGQQTSEMCRST